MDKKLSAQNVVRSVRGSELLMAVGRMVDQFVLGTWRAARKADESAAAEGNGYALIGSRRAQFWSATLGLRTAAFSRTRPYICFPLFEAAALRCGLPRLFLRPHRRRRHERECVFSKRARDRFQCLGLFILVRYICLPGRYQTCPGLKNTGSIPPTSGDGADWRARYLK